MSRYSIVAARHAPLERELVRDPWSWASAMIGRRRRYFAHARAVPPLVVGTIERDGVDVVGERHRRVHDGGGGPADVRLVAAADDEDSSTTIAMSDMASTACTGYAPMLVSAESITAEVPSMTALATSPASARVGSGG